MSRQSILNVICLLCLFWTSGGLQANEALAGKALIDAIKTGGYSIYFRHERTDWNLFDNYMHNDQRFSCDPAKMRQLSEQGRQRSRDTGAAMRAVGIPVNEVIASPYCRTVETAKLMDLGPVTPSNDVMNLRVASYYGGREVIIKTAQALLAKPTTPGFNRVIVAHGNVAQAATPVYPDEGEAVIFKATQDGRFVVIGRIKTEEWRD